MSENQQSSASRGHSRAAGEQTDVSAKLCLTRKKCRTGAWRMQGALDGLAVGGIWTACSLSRMHLSLAQTESSKYVCRHMVRGAGWGRAAEAIRGLPAASHSLVGMHHHAHFTDKVR